ncbi:MAG: hypothetical protein NXH85_18605 [Pseudomonadaceae bacterium]|nr:hypothetical protein [Pseudomonadaceae bacterium]
MKWFKHETNLRNVEEVAIYLDQCRDSMVGYGVLMAVIEVIAAKMEGKNSRPAAQYPERTWLRLCDVQRNRWRSHLKLLASSGLVEHELIDGRLRVEFPKLLIWLDEYTKKSRRRLDKVPVEEKENRGRKDKKRKEEEEEENDSPSAIAPPIPPAADLPRESQPPADLPAKVVALVDFQWDLVSTDNRSDTTKACRLINQRDGNKRREPTQKMFEVVRDIGCKHAIKKGLHND